MDSLIDLWTIIRLGKEQKTEEYFWGAADATAYRQSYVTSSGDARKGQARSLSNRSHSSPDKAIQLFSTTIPRRLQICFHPTLWRSLSAVNRYPTVANVDVGFSQSLSNFRLPADWLQYLNIIAVRLSSQNRSIIYQELSLRIWLSFAYYVSVILVLAIEQQLPHLRQYT